MAEQINMEVLNRCKSEWTFRKRTKLTGYEVITKDKGYSVCDFTKNGRLKKNAAKSSMWVCTTGTEEMARQICDGHNFCIAPDRAAFIRAEIEVELKRRFGANEGELRGEQ